MADINVLDQKLGPETDIDIVLQADGKAMLIVKYEGADGGGEVKVYLKTVKLLGKLKDLIPGKLDDMIIDAATGLLVQP